MGQSRCGKRAPAGLLAAVGIFFVLCCLRPAPLGASDIRHYDLLIAPDFSTRAISVTASVRIDNPQLEREFLFGLNDRYDSVAVTSPMSPVKIERNAGWISVTVEQPSAEMILNFDLKGVLGQSNDEKRAVVADSSLFLLWSDRFYPISYDDWATVRTTVILPEGFEALAPGRAVKVASAGGRVTHVFETKNPTVCFSVLADRRWIRTQRKIGKIPMQTLLYPVSQRFADQIFRTSAEVLAFYSECYGPYSFDQFSFANIEGIYARLAFPGFVGYNPSYLEKEFTTTGLDAHETALLWWFYTSRGSGPGAFQWSEGFGDYAEILYDEQYKKPIPAIFERFRDEYLAVAPAEDVPYVELKGSTPQKIVHGKYPWLMHMVRYAAGDEPFRRAMRLLFERYRFRTFTISEFIGTLEEGTHQSLQWWREGWLERSGVPTITMRYSGTKMDSRYETTVILEQSDPPRFVPIEIGIETGGRMRIERISLTEDRMTKVFITPRKPDRVLLDPNGWVLAKKVVEAQP